MKKLITLTFVITALLLGAFAIQGQPYKKKNKAKVVKNNRYINNGYNNGNYNRRGVYVYHQTKNVWKHGQLYKNTYKIKVFPNGRKNVKLINSVKVRRNNRVQTFYRTQNVRQGFRMYRVTYKFTKYPSGYVNKKLVKKQRLYRW